MSDQPKETESRRALHELIDLLGEVDQRWVSPEWNLHSDEDVFGAHRAVMHYLQWGLVGLLERDPAAPRFHRIVSPDRKVLGDNPDAVYFDAPVSADHAYRVTGEIKGATYVSITVESGEAWGSMDNQTVGVLNDESFDTDADGRFEILIGGEPRPRNWLGLPEVAGSISTRHYFEDPTYAAADPGRVPEMRIEVIDAGGNPVTAPPPRPSDASVAAGIRRVAGLVRELTVDRPPHASAEPRSWISRVPNVFPPPDKPGDLGLAAFDAAYAMAPFLIGPDEGARDPGPLAAVPLRQRVPVEPAPADLRLRQPVGLAQPGPDRRRRRRPLHRGHRPCRPRCAQLARHRGPPLRRRLLALYAPRRRHRDPPRPR